jgi:hypothetical protein
MNSREILEKVVAKHVSQNGYAINVKELPYDILLDLYKSIVQ